MLFVVVHSQNVQSRSVLLRDVYVLDCVQLTKILKLCHWKWDIIAYTETSFPHTNTIMLWQHENIVR